MTGMVVLSHQGRKDGDMMELKIRQQGMREQDMNMEVVQSGRKKLPIHRQADETKGRNWMRAHASSCQLWDTPPPSGPLRKLEASLLLPTLLCILFLLSSGGVMFFTFCFTLSTPTRPGVLLNQTSGITNGCTRAQTSLSRNVCTDSLGRSHLAQFPIMSGAKKQEHMRVDKHSIRVVSYPFDLKMNPKEKPMDVTINKSVMSHIKSVTFTGYMDLSSFFGWCLWYPVLQIIAIFFSFFFLRSILQRDSLCHCSHATTWPNQHPNWTHGVKPETRENISVANFWKTSTVFVVCWALSDCGGERGVGGKKQEHTHTHTHTDDRHTGSPPSCTNI